MDKDELIQELLQTIKELRITNANLQSSSFTLSPTAVVTSSSPSKSKEQETQGFAERLPFEIWEHHILPYLYPSQIARLSRASQTFYNMISSSRCWSKLFRKLFGIWTLLDTLPAMPESKSYMLYICAISSRICEKCLTYVTPASSTNPQDMAARPLPIQLPNAYLRRRGRDQYRPSSNNSSPRESNSHSTMVQLNNITVQLPTFSSISYIGEPMEGGWSIQMCLKCRLRHLAQYPEPDYVDPRNEQFGTYLTEEETKRRYNLTDLELSNLPHKFDHYGATDPSKKKYFEAAAISASRKKQGGSVGVAKHREIAEFSQDRQEQKTRARILAYGTR
ncbi:hypothetical protein BGZ83_006481 [Gryganskiella cystojenkinii]|nr:hypothetical protein BGZ83_006481 [Gryganskiella cystojenkinii]